MGLGNQLEGFATLANPTIQIYNLTVGTTAFQCAFDANPGQIVRTRIINLSSTAQIAVTLTDRSSPTAAPAVIRVNSSLTAGASGAGVTSFGNQNMACSATGAVALTDGIRIAPGATLELNFTASTKLWVVASAATTQCQIVGILQNG